MSTFPDADLPLKFAIRFDGTTWADLSSRMLKGQPASRTTGRASGAGRASAGSFSITLNNDDGALTPRNPGSAYWPNVRLDVAGRSFLQWFADQFTRTQTDTWGSDWTNSGGAGTDYDVNGTAGTHTLTSVAVLRSSSATPAVETPDITACTSWSATATGGSLVSWTAAAADVSNMYVAVLEATTAGTVLLSLVRYVAGTPTTLAAGVQVGTYTPGAHWSARVQHLAGQIVRAKAWAGDPEVQPDTWTHTVQDSTLTSLPRVILLSGRLTGNTNVNPVVSWHEVQVNADQAMGFTDSWAPDFVTDTNGYVHSVCRVTASGVLRRLSQGEQPLRSPLFRSMAGIAPRDYIPWAYWPMEDGSNATRFASGLSGGRPMTFTGAVSLGADATLPGSEPLPTFGPGSSAYFAVPAYTDTDHWVLQTVVELNAACTIYDLSTTGAGRRVTVAYNAGTSNIDINVFDASGTNVYTGGFAITAAAIGQWLSFTFGMRGDLATDQFNCTYQIRGQGSVFGFGDLIPGQYGMIAAGTLMYGTTGTNAAGHHGLFIDPAFRHGIDDTYNARAMNGWLSEDAADRVDRIGHEIGMPVLIVGNRSAPMGFQPVNTLPEVLGQCEDAEQGVLGEHELGLVFVTAAARYNQPVTLTIDLRTYRITTGTEDTVLTPVYDDQNVITASTVDMPDGSAVIVTAVMPRSNLPYEDQVTGNVDSDTQAVQLGAFRANRGSVDVMRFPATPIDLRANPAMIAAWQKATAVAGLGRIVRTGLPATHAPYDLDELVDGCSDTYNPRAWTADYNGQPAAAYQVGQYTDGRTRYGAKGTTTAEVLDATETGIDITVTAGHPGWVTTASHPACYSPAMLIEIGGERMGASACVSTGAGTYTLTVTRNLNGIPGGKAHATGAEVFIVDTGRYGY